MILPIPVSSAGESPSASSPHHVLFAGVLIHSQTLELLGRVKLEEVPESGLELSTLAEGAQTFVESVASELKTSPAIERALQLYLEQRLTGYGYRHSEVIVKALTHQ